MNPLNGVIMPSIKEQLINLENTYGPILDKQTSELLTTCENLNITYNNLYKAMVNMIIQLQTEADQYKTAKKEREICDIHCQR
jgi:hypothetical protein